MHDLDTSGQVSKGYQSTKFFQNQTPPSANNYRITAAKWDVPIIKCKAWFFIECLWSLGTSTSDTQVSLNSSAQQALHHHHPQETRTTSACIPAKSLHSALPYPWSQGLQLLFTNPKLNGVQYRGHRLRSSNHSEPLTSFERGKNTILLHYTLRISETELVV